MVDCRVPHRFTHDFLFVYMGRVLYRRVKAELEIQLIANLFIHTGQLFLGVISGPVEGIIMIVCVYLMTGYFG